MTENKNYFFSFITQLLLIFAIAGCSFFIYQNYRLRNDLSYRFLSSPSKTEQMVNDTVDQIASTIQKTTKTIENNLKPKIIKKTRVVKVDFLDILKKFVYVCGYLIFYMVCGYLLFSLITWLKKCLFSSRDETYQPTHNQFKTIDNVTTFNHYE